jgi:hypothetical protein
MTVNQRQTSSTSHGECPACGSTGARALALSEGHGEVRMGCPACRHVWVIADRRKKRRSRADSPPQHATNGTSAKS